MTNEEAIAIIRKEYSCVDRDCNIEISCGKCDLMMPTKEPILQAYKTAIKALEELPKRRTEAKTVLYSGDGYADGYMVYDMAECPNCGYEYEESDKDWGLPFCPNCGQSLIWESEDEEQA